jgi:transposase-like protein
VPKSFRVYSMIEGLKCPFCSSEKVRFGLESERSNGWKAEWEDGYTTYLNFVKCISCKKKFWIEPNEQIK